jgi:hypothetical protein
MTNNAQTANALTAAEIATLIQSITNRLASVIYVGMTHKQHDSVVQATNDLQVISNLLCRSMPLRREDWQGRYVL